MILVRILFETPALISTPNLDRLSPRRLNQQQVVKPINLQQLHQGRPDAAQDRAAPLERGEHLAHRHQRAGRLIRPVLHFFEIGDFDAAVVFRVDKPLDRGRDLIRLVGIHKRVGDERDDGKRLNLSDGECSVHRDLVSHRGPQP